MLAGQKKSADHGHNQDQQPGELGPGSFPDLAFQKLLRWFFLWHLLFLGEAFLTDADSSWAGPGHSTQRRC